MKVTYSKDSIQGRTGEPHNTNDKIYVWSTGDKEISVDDCKQTVIPEALEKLKKSHPTVYNMVKDNDWKFMQNCGCTCGCSPGFVGGTKNIINIHIEI